MTFFQKIAQVCALALILTGCSTTARKDMELHDDCLHKQSRIVIAQISGLEKARFFRLGEQGFVDLIINSAMTDGMAEKVEVIDTKSLLEEHYYGPFERFLSQHCLEVSKMYEPLDREKLAPPPIDEEKYAPYDFRQLKKTGAQYAVILHPQQFGAQRYYKGFIPLGPPHAITSLRVYMVRLSDNTLVGHYNVAKVHEVQGAWDNPPEYKELIRAVEGSLGEALEEADMYFFGDFVGDLED
jgi:hypothetical protein